MSMNGDGGREGGLDTHRYTRGGVAGPGTTLVADTGSWRVQRPVHHHRTAPCAHACPAGEDPQAYLAQLEQGQPRAAWEVLVAANPLPAVTGRVCPHPCEAGCSRAAIDEAVAIHHVERHLGDSALHEGWALPATTPATGAARVAVVGAGPAGLSCAWQLLRLGHRVTVLEAETQAGGACASAIPPYRLPRTVLEGETARLLALPGIDYQPRRRLGREFTLEELRDGYDAVFLAVGAKRPRTWNIDGAVPSDLHAGLALLEEWVRVGRIPTPASAAVIGGGNTAIDLARVLRGAGVGRVCVITHNGLPGPEVPPEDAMRALPREIAQAREEGVEILAHRGVRRLILRGERVVGVEMVHMKKLPDANGRLRRVAFDGTETVLHVDMVIPAIGEEVEPAGLEALLAGAGSVEVDAAGATTLAGVYAGGDATPHGGTVTAAVGAGRLAAAAIDRRLRAVAEAPPEKDDPIGIEQLNLAYFESAARAREALLPVAERDGDAEIDRGLSAAQATGEARRCLSCGECLACDNCFTLCPDSAVLKTRETAFDGSHYVFDYQHCKGCGLCANECPCGYIEMIVEV